MSVVTDVPVSRHAVEAVALGAYPQAVPSVFEHSIDAVAHFDRLLHDVALAVKVARDFRVEEAILILYIKMKMVQLMLIII